MHHSNHMYLGQKYILFSPSDLERSYWASEDRKGFLWEEQNSLELWNIGISSNMLINY